MSAQSRETIVRNTVLRMLKPLARLSMRHSLKLNELIELAKTAFVQAAQEELDKQGESQSLSRISVMTGVHRKDVTRLVREPENETQPKNIISKVMVQWQHAARFTTKAGKPRSLEAEGRNSEFAALVASVNGANLNAYTVLKEMERLGVVKRQGKRVTLEWRDYVASNDFQDGMEMLAEDGDDLVTAVSQNLFEDSELKNLHLKTEFDRIPRDSIPEIKKWLIEEGSAFHHKVRNFLSKYDLDFRKAKSSKQKVARVSFASFSLASNIEGVER